MKGVSISPLWKAGHSESNGLFLWLGRRDVVVENRAVQRRVGRVKRRCLA
jgi:hypothetical protein